MSRGSAGGFCGGCGLGRATGGAGGLRLGAGPEVACPKSRSRGVSRPRWRQSRTPFCPPGPALAARRASSTNETPTAGTSLGNQAARDRPTEIGSQAVRISRRYEPAATPWWIHNQTSTGVAVRRGCDPEERSRWRAGRRRQLLLSASGRILMLAHNREARLPFRVGQNECGPGVVAQQHLGIGKGRSVCQRAPCQ